MNQARHIKAVKLGGKTMIGSSGDFPRDHGNCFDLIGEDKKSYRIVNFVCENFEELQRRGLKWPVHIAVISENERCGLAAFNDPRVGDQWYSNRWCEVCCPSDLLPIPQILEHRREEARGERTEKNGWVEKKIITKPIF